MANLAANNRIDGALKLMPLSIKTKKYHRFWQSGLVFVLAWFLFALPLDAETQKFWLNEGGPIETVSAVGYIICIAVYLWACWSAGVKARVYIPILLLILAFRELDFDKAFVTDGLLRSSQYLGSRTGPIEKLISATVMVSILTALFYLIRNHFSEFLNGLKRLDPFAISLFFAFAFMGTSKFFDGIARKLKPLGINVNEEWRTNAWVYEETTEMGIPIMLLCAILIFYSREKAKLNY